MLPDDCKDKDSLNTIKSKAKKMETGKTILPNSVKFTIIIWVLFESKKDPATCNIYIVFF